MRRTRRPDELTSPDLVGSETAEMIYAATRSLDRVAVGMEETWGVDRLPTLVGVEMASRFGQAKAKLDAAIAADDGPEVVRRAAVLERGWAAMDEAARRAGHKPIEVAAWVWHADDGTPHAFVRDVAEARAYAAQSPGVAVWTMAEIQRVAAAFKVGAAIKTTFPAAEIVDRPADNLNDEISW